MNYEKLTQKKQLLDNFRPLPSALVHNLDEWFKIELTYASNAIEGNTLTRAETALVVEKGITVGGKTLIEHLEATNHASAIEWVKNQIKRKANSLNEKDILKIHDIILKGIDDENCGHYRNIAVRISGSNVILPNPLKVPDLMSDFINWLKVSNNLHPVELAAMAHYKLVSIHLFSDGNGRTARLLMNMILLMFGYPIAIIRKTDRLAYINSLEKAQLGGSINDYMNIITKATNRSLDIYLKAAKGEEAAQDIDDKLLKIGELAKLSEESNSTIRHWTKQGLLEVAEITKAGYYLYSAEMVSRIEKIHELKQQRLSLEEIKDRMQNKVISP